jgi:beta-ureidopropionase
MSKQRGFNIASDRRSFIRSTATIATASLTGAMLTTPTSHAQSTATNKAPNRLPREVAIATIAQEGLSADSPAQMANQLLGRMQQASKMAPDIVCLPELCAFSNLSGAQPQPANLTDELLSPIQEKFAAFARDHHCYVVLPIYTRDNGKIFNAVVFLDRKGETVGQYRKCYATTDEMENGVCPGELNAHNQASVVKADFGKIGAQICFDIQWDAGWRKLRDSGAEIVFWPSAFAGGQMVNTRAWQNRYCVVSSTNKDVSKICDITGAELAATSRWHPWVCATVNLEKAFLHTWPYVQRFQDITSKYGPKVRITSHAAEEWSILESRDLEVKIADVMKEFELLTIDEHLKAAEKMQAARRL